MAFIITCKELIKLHIADDGYFLPQYFQEVYNAILDIFR